MLTISPPLLWLVNPGVVGARHAREILQAVIRPVVVHVVNYMTLGNRAVCPLPYQDVLGLVRVGSSPDIDISIAPRPTATLPPTSQCSRQSSSVVPMYESERPASNVTECSYGDLCDLGLASASALAKARRLPDIGRWIGTGGMFHLAKSLSVRPVALKEAGRSVRVLLATRRQLAAAAACT
jgi:hypothetical protein